MNFSVMHHVTILVCGQSIKKTEECVTLQNDFLEMSYELNIRITFLAPLLLGDF